MPGTNAVYTFKRIGKNNSDVHVYDNCDAYPQGAADKLVAAKLSSGKADLRAVASALTIGDVRDSLEMRVTAPDWRQTCATNFRYEIKKVKGQVRVTGFRPDVEENLKLKPGKNFPKWEKIFDGTVPEFIKWSRGKNYIAA